jgi:hypothetical protein
MSKKGPDCDQAGPLYGIAALYELKAGALSVLFWIKKTGHQPITVELNYENIAL